MIEIAAGVCIPVFGYLWRLGGSKHKAWRRFAIPIIATVLALLDSFSWFVVVAGFLHHLILRLPFTLKGDSLDADDINWFWVPVWSGLISAPMFLHAFNGWVLSAWLVATTVTFTCASFSNLDPENEVFHWDNCERAFGAMTGLVFFVAALTR